MTSERKPLAALLIASKAKPGDGAAPADDTADEGDDELATAQEAASLMGSKDPAAAASALVDTIRQCIARSKAGKY